MDLLVIFFVFCLGVPFISYILNFFNMIPFEVGSGAIYFSIYMLIFPCYAVSRVGMEIIWWKASDNNLLRLETTFILCYALMLLVSLLYWPTWMAIMCTTLIFGVVRMIYIIQRSKKMVSVVGK